MQALRTILFVITITSILSNVSVAQNNAQCRAIVQDRKVKFTFPLPDNKEFKWNQTRSDDNYPEYVWNISLEGSNPQYKFEFGIYLYKFPRATEKTGSLRELLSEAQFSVWDLKTSKVRDDLVIEVRIQDGKLSILVTDGVTFKELFSNKPIKAHFRVHTPYNRLNLESTTPIEYVN